MKARICKMINIMVLIYIFNPIFASALTDQNQSISREYQPIYISSSLKHTQHSLASKHPDSYTSNREDQTGDIASYKVESSQDIPLTSQDIIKQTGDSNPKLIPSNIPGIQSAPQLKTSAIHLEQKNYSIDTQYPQKTIAVDSFLQQQLLKSPKSSLKLDSQSLPHLQSQVLSAKHTPKTSILASKGSLRAFGKEGTDNIYQACGEEVLQSVGSSISLVNKNIAPKTNVQKKYTGDSQHLEGESSPVYIQLKHEKKTTPQILAGLETNAVAVETQLASFQPAENNQESTLNAFIKNSSQETPSQVTNNQRGQDLVKFKQNTFYLANKILTSGVDSSLLLPKGNLHSPSSQVDILLADNSSSNKAEVQMYSSPEIDYTGASQPQQSSHILATAMLSLDNLSTFKLNTDSNHNGCNDSLEQEPHLASHCNFLKQQIVPSKQLPQLNLNRTQNVFNTNKTVINGVYKPNAKLELHVINQGQDKIIAIIDTDKNANFIYLLDFDYLPLEGSLYLRSKDGSESKFYPYQVKIQNKIPQCRNLLEKFYLHYKY